MADAYDAAQTALNQQKAAMLAAMAQNGSQGRALYDQSQADLANQRSNAVNGALADAQRRGAPSGMLDLISSEVGAPYARRSMDIDSSHQAQDQWLSNLGLAHSAYMDQASAAIPTLRAQSERAAMAAAAKASKSSGGRGGGGVKFSSALASGASKLAVPAHQKAIRDQISRDPAFGPKSQAAFAKLTSAKDLNAALQLLEAGTQAYWEDSSGNQRPNGKPFKNSAGVREVPTRTRSAIFWRGKPVKGLISYDKLRSAIEQYFGSPSSDEFGAAQQQFYNQGSY